MYSSAFNTQGSQKVLESLVNLEDTFLPSWTDGSMLEFQGG